MSSEIYSSNIVARKEIGLSNFHQKLQNHFISEVTKQVNLQIQLITRPN